MQPAGHGHCEQRHHKHGVDGLNETFRLLRNHLIQATDSGFKQHRGNACRKTQNKPLITMCFNVIGLRSLTKHVVDFVSVKLLWQRECCGGAISAEQAQIQMKERHSLEEEF